MGLLEALKQFASDAAGGSLNPEVGNTLSGLLNYGKDRAKYIGGLLDDSSPINKDFKNWHDRTQLGLADLIAGREGPQADYGYSQIMNMAGVAPVGMTAWHGSPHKFDKFSLDKIGTGEGAQAYGHGLYLAESPDVAREYAQTLDPMAAAARSGIDAEGTAARVLQGVDFNKQRAIDELTRRKNAPHVQGDAEWAAKMDAAIAHIQGTDKTSNLYKTDIPDEAVARFLDWDKPLSQQAPEVQAAFESRVSPIRAEMAKPADPGWGDLAAPSNFDPTGQELLGLLRNRDASLTAQQFLGNGLGPDISTALKQQGIPGIRYLDGGSRSAGQGSSNFVAFDPEMIRILERNGQPTGLEPWKPGEYRLGDLLK